MKNSVISLIVAVFVGVLFNGCASTKLKESHVDESFKGKTVSNVLVIGVSSDESNRRLFEKTFVQQLNAVGVTAISSIDALSIPADQKMEKETILEVVNKFKNDAVLVTHIVGIDKRKSYKPAVYSMGVNYYGRYRYYHANRIKASSVSSHTNLFLETELFDVEEEKLMWSGQSETVASDSIKQMIDGVIKVAVKEMQKNKLLPKK
jgi:hypothetical protein